MAKSLTVSTVDIHQLAAIVKNRIDNALILDSRSFLEYNVSHINNAINVGCAKLMKRRLQQEKLCIEDFLAQSCHWNVDRSIDIIVYDQNTRDVSYLSPDSFMAVFLQKLLPVYNSVNVLKGGFLEFQAAYPSLCEEERSKYAPLTSLSQPCLPISNHGPTRILPFLYLGSQQDALNREALQHYNITYQLNVSTSCPKPDFIQESYFMRIPVIDNYSEKLLPHFPKAFQFLDKVKESSGCVLVHCLAGVSRSATVAIAYVMKTLKMTSDEAYRFVKGKRTTISPNFNFLGQLLEYEKHLQREHILKLNKEPSTAPLFSASSPTYEQTYQTNSTACYSTKLKERSLSCKNSYEFTSSTYQASHTEEHVTTYKQNSPKLDTYFCIPNKQPTALNVKCLPVSSLRELNFTPCQTALKMTRSEKLEDMSPTKTFNAHLRKNPEIQVKVCDEEPKQSLVSPLSDLKAFEFSAKSYNRTDSVSTSGLGSEESDYSDSWNEFTSSCERESDILMDDDYPTVPTGTVGLLRNKSSGFEDSYDDSLSLYPKCEPHYNNGLSHQFPGESCWNAKKCNSKYEENLKYSGQHPTPISDEIGGAQFLYRAQSCPGMLSSDSDSNHSQTNTSVRLRRHKPSNSNRDKTKNRYSCSSIDYMDYSLTVGLSHESCPDVVQRSENPKISSHSNYRHSMIEVS